ncbi:CIC11C00000005541 [Sungouiella intermedia]|uniref:CIC11C00000005541 n=1 Tax=Sungouiella intermedia TaxID=45354 RepID=A0A1L0BGY5_9ASCO|nr:CIC11C00000005541 [[Candida] intermedia]
MIALGRIPLAPLVSRVTQVTQMRNISFLKKLLSLDTAESQDAERQLYTWDESPYEDIRTRAAYIRTKANVP